MFVFKKKKKPALENSRALCYVPVKLTLIDFIQCQGNIYLYCNNIFSWPPFLCFHIENSTFTELFFFFLNRVLLLRCKLGVLQYTVVRPVTTVIAL